MNIFTTTVVAFLCLLGQGLTYDDGYWTPSPTTTAWWTPTTTSYWAYWTPSTTYTTCWTQENVVVTVTSVIPCPVTSTVVYWECCDQCATNCNYPPTTTYDYGYGVGTTTVTSYTTTTPTAAAAAGLRTTTSNGLVIVVVDSSTAGTTPSQTASVVYQVVSDAQDKGPNSSLWSVGMFLAIVATVMILL